MKTSWLFVAVSLLFSVNALAEKSFTFEEAEAQPQLTSAGVSSPYMECLVDTPAYDPITRGYCFGAAWPRTTSAYFRIQGVPSNFKVYWSHPSCNSNQSHCTLTIRQYMPITLSADVLNQDTQTYFSVSATAHYEGLH
mgnify:FL=1